MSPDPERTSPSDAPVSDDEGPHGSTHRFRVRVDPDLLDLIPGYLESRRKDAGKIREAVDRGDFETVRIVGHSMAGSGGGYGFTGISRIGRHLVKGAAARDAEGIRMAVRELETYLDRVVVESA